MIPSSNIWKYLKEESLRNVKAQRNKVVKGECPGLRLMNGGQEEGQADEGWRTSKAHLLASPSPLPAYLLGADRR